MNEQSSGESPREPVVDRNLSGVQGATVRSREEDQPISDVDLTTTEEPEISASDFVTVGIQEEFEQRIRGRQEWVRTALAVGAFLSLVAVLVFLMASVYSGITVDNIEKVATVVVTPLTGIVGTIIGFYFAERRSGGTRE